MRLVLAGIVFVALAASSGLGQEPVAPPRPSLSYELHAEKLAHVNPLSMTTIAVAPRAVIGATVDRHSLLVLLPHAGRMWELQRLTGWDTASPRTETLSFDGDPSNDKMDFVTADMTPTPDGSQLLVRIMVCELKTFDRNAVVVLVDLKAFQVVWRRFSSDLLVSDSRLRFSGSGALIAAEGLVPGNAAERKVAYSDVYSDVITRNPVAVGDHEAGVLSFPGLERRGFSCRYAVEMGRPEPVGEPAIAASADPFEDRPFDEGDMVPGKFLKGVLRSDGCAGLLKVAGVPSAANLPGPIDGKLVDWLAGSECEIRALGEGARQAFYWCRSTNKDDKNRLEITSEEMRVLDLKGDGKGLVIPLHHSEDVSGTLVTADGRDYLVLVRKGVKVELYALR